MRRLDDLLGQLTIDVPDPPTVEELRSRVTQRHRRPSHVVAVLVGIVLVAAGIVASIEINGASSPECIRWPTVASRAPSRPPG